MEVPQFVQEIVRVTDAARIGETSSVVVDEGLLVNNISFALLRIDRVCCPFVWVLVGFCWMLGIKVMSLERLHHTVEQFVMVPLIVEEMCKVLEAAFFSHTALYDAIQVSTVQSINALCGSASGFASMRFQSSRFTGTIVSIPKSSLRYVLGY